MNQHRKGNAFRDINVPGDPRLLDAINRRTPQAGGMQVTHTHSGTIITGKKQRKGAKDTAPPFWSRLVKNEEVWNLWIEKGFVIIRQNFDPVITHIEPSSIPTKDAPFVVIDGSKIWVKETISATGITTAAVMETGSAWPASEQAELKGGDVTDGVEGSRIVRIAEVITDPDSESETPGLIRKQLLTGHIDAFQPELVENTVDGAPSGSEERGRILKKFDADTGKWMVRGIAGDEGIEVIEGDDIITIKGKAGAGDDFNIGYRTLTITQDSDPPVVNFSVGSGIDKWVYVRGGVHFLNRDNVDTPDDTGTGAGSVYPRVIHLLPLDTAGTSGTSIPFADRGGWINPVEV